MNLFAALQVANAAAVHRALHRVADLVFVALQKALAVADGLVLAGQPAVDDLLKCHGVLSFNLFGCMPWHRLGRATWHTRFGRRARGAAGEVFRSSS
ncbi:hypothetical protein [Ideonella paludis]|uniref:hypothetical protein n=1 Tax=Ideonella paludis TaxID=1233411 RepID=UPI003643269E